MSCVLNLLFDEMVGNPFDTSGYGNNGTITGATWAQGRIGGALSFDGNDYVTCNNSLSLANITEQLTMEVWVKIDSSSFESGYFLIKNNVGVADAQYSMVWYESRHSIAVFLNGAQRGESLAEAVLPGKWYHIVGTYDKVNVRIYINGVLNTTTGYNVALTTTTHTLNIGRRKPDDYHLIGLLDSVRVYNHQLSADDVQAHFNGGRFKPFR